MQLIRRRPVLGIEHGGERAAGERKRGVERLRLGARAAVGRDQGFEGQPEFQPRQRALRPAIVRLEDEHDLEFLKILAVGQGRVVREFRFLEQFARLVVQRHDDRVEGQIVGWDAQRAPPFPADCRPDKA